MRTASLAVFFTAVAGLYSQSPGIEQTIETIQAAIEKGDQTGAWRLVDDALTRHPLEAGLINLRGIIHAQRAEMAEAREDFQQAARLAPGLLPAWRNLARACQILTDHDSTATTCAAEAWEHVVRALPDDTEALTALATVFEWQGKFADSLRELAKLPPAENSRTSLLALRCGDLAGLDRNAEAADVAASLARAEDFSEEDGASIFPVLASARHANLVVTLVEALDTRGKASAISLRPLAVAYEQLNRLPDARRTLERVAVQDAANPQHLLELARLAHLSHDLEGCIGYLGHARDLAPGNARIHFLFGLVAVEMELPVEARRSLDKALDIDPANPEYNYAMGGVLLSGGQATESIPYFAKYAAALPDDARGHFALGAAYFGALDYDKCRAEMLRIAQDPKTEAGAAYFLGRVARMEENYDEALRHLEHAIKLAPSFAEAHNELARVRIAQGRPAEARAAVDRALALEPDSFQANSTLLTVLQLTHDPAAEQQAAHLRTLDAARSRRRELLMRTIEVKPY
ncbi:MAG TPA: tetratricopeptide repeat protein [Bryobacteraceae bacterium]|nr:tetratricopeptide repeat protein [Bryobacteraceae bacterium]